MSQPASLKSIGLDPALLTALGDLELVARVTVEGMLSGLHNSPYHGYSAEFSQYRQYRTGDDLKYVDWKLFARTDRLYTKQYRETTNLVGARPGRRQPVDGVPRRDGCREDRLRAGDRRGARLSGRRTGRWCRGCRSTTTKSGSSSRAGTGQSHLRAVLAALSKMQTSGATAGAQSLKRSIDMLGRRGLLILVSDLYDDEEAVEAELRRAVRMGHEVAVFHVLTRDDWSFRSDRKWSSRISSLAAAY